MNNLFQDIQYGIRMLVRHPGFTAVAVMTLALGIGANTAIFSVVDAVMLRPLPFANPDRLIEIWQARPGGEFFYPGLRKEAFDEWGSQPTLFEQVESYDTRSFVLTGGAEPESIPGPAVSPGLFPFLGVKPMLGRLFQPSEGEPGNDRVALIGEGLWKRYFGADPEAIGKAITLNDEPYTIVGVMPPEFKFPYGKFQLWVPLSPSPGGDKERPIRYHAIARLREGVSLTAAQAAVDAISKTLEQQKPDRAGWGARLRLMDDNRVNPQPRRALWVLFGAVGFVLLLACVNAANLLLSRASVRQKEIAIRAALGAGRLRLVRQLLTESAMLALLGGLFGALLALWGVDYIVRMVPSELTFLSVNEIGIDMRVLAFTVGVSALTGIIFGLVPAIRISRTDVQQTLKSATRSATSDRSHNRLRSVLVVAEVALSLVLLIGAGLMIKSFVQLSNVPPGFDANNLMAVTMSLPSRKYPTPVHQQEFFNQVKANVAALPGVESVTGADGVPPHGGGISFNFKLEIEGRPPEPVDPDFILASDYVEPDYFKVMRIPILQGRSFSDEDTPNTPRVVIVNDEWARRYWPGENAVGKRMRFGGEERPWLTVVGVVGDVKVMGLNDPYGPMEIYYAYNQKERPDFQRTLLVRTVGDPNEAISAVKGQIYAIEKDQPIYRISSVEQLISESLDEPRFYLMLMSLFAGVAALLVSMGIYSVISYLVSQRTHEIGIRMALGAQTGHVLKLVVGKGMLLAVIGIAIGMGGAYALTRLMTSLLFGVSPTDPLVFVGIALLLLAVTGLACYMPARRATKIDPMEALRYE